MADRPPLSGAGAHHPFLFSSPARSLPAQHYYICSSSSFSLSSSTKLSIIAHQFISSDFRLRPRVRDLAESPEGPQGPRPRRAHCRPLPPLSLSSATPSPPVPLMVVALVVLARLVLLLAARRFVPFQRKTT